MSWTPAVSPAVSAGIRPTVRSTAHPAGRALRAVSPDLAAAVRPAALPRPGRHLRLTRRGRVVVLLALVTLLLAAFSLGRVGTQAAPRGAAQAPALAETTVQPGETLWAVATRVDPGHDPRALVLELQRLNHLDDGAVQAGQLLVLPRRG